MSSYYMTDARILRSYDRGEADRVLVCYTEALGRIDVVGKGLRLEKSKLRGHVLPFHPVRLFVASGKEQWRLLDIESAPYERRDAALPYIHEYASFLLRLVTDFEPNEQLWKTVSRIGEVDSYERLSALKIRTLLALGLLPSKNGLREFFTPRAALFIAGEKDATFFRDPQELLEFNKAIERILSSNHIT